MLTREQKDEQERTEITIFELYQERTEEAVRKGEALNEVAEWAVKVLVAYSDKGVARPYSEAYTEALNRFWQLIENPPPTVLERLDLERVYFLGGR